MSTTHDQQPIQRVVGSRQPRDGRPLTSDDRTAMSHQARYRTRAPKGVFFYQSAEEMDRDRLRWTVDAMVAKLR